MFLLGTRGDSCSSHAWEGRWVGKEGNRTAVFLPCLFISFLQELIEIKVLLSLLEMSLTVRVKFVDTFLIEFMIFFLNGEDGNVSCLLPNINCVTHRILPTP